MGALIQNVSGHVYRVLMEQNEQIGNAPNLGQSASVYPSLEAGRFHGHQHGSKQERPRGARGNFFLVDLSTFAKVCDLDDPDAAACYLILAAGTMADNRTTSWSREAINQRTALNWRKADACIRKLEANGLLRWKRRGARPRIDLLAVETRSPMRQPLKNLAEKIEGGDQPRTPADLKYAEEGRRLGWLQQGSDGIWSVLRDRPLEKAYLPNSLVGDEKGKATGRTTIVENIRKARDPMAFRLLVDLYAAQDLAELSGVDRACLRASFKRERLTAKGGLVIWQFFDRSKWVTWDGRLDHHWREPTKEEAENGKYPGTGIFERVSILEDAGALEWVYYLAEDETASSILSYPVAVVRHGKLVWNELETMIGNYALRAGCAVAGIASEIEQWESPNFFCLPSDRVARQAALVGIPRLRCRAKTKNAARWRAELIEGAEAQIAMFRGIIADYAPELLCEADERLGKFSDGSVQGSAFLQSGYDDQIQPAEQDDDLECLDELLGWKTA